jgi:hypothetical protein
MKNDLVCAAAAFLLLAAPHALAQQSAAKSPPYPMVGGFAAEPVVPMVWDASSNAFVPQGSGYVAQTFAGTGSLQIASAGIGTVTVQASGSGGGLGFVFQGSSDGGTTWQILPGFVPSSGAAATSFSGNGIWQANPAGFTLFRVNLTAIASGAETFTVTTSTAQSVFNGANVAVTASVANGTQVKILDSAGTNVAAVTAAGELEIDCTTGCNGSNGSVSGTGSAVPGSATYLGGTNGGTLQGISVNGSGQIAIQALPAGGNSIGTVNAAESGTWTVQPGNAANTTPWLVVESPNALGCGGQSIASTTVTPISLTASAQLLAGTSGKQTYICHIHLVAAAADNVAVVEGTGTTCATSPAGIFGGATAATGWNFAANGGIELGDGRGVVGRTATAADNICILVSGTGQVSGVIVTVQM